MTHERSVSSVCWRQIVASGWKFGRGCALAMAIAAGWMVMSPVREARAQVAGTGTIQGIVTDSTGSVIAGVQVTATNPATGRTFSQPTSSAGVYVLSALPPGDYTVDFKASGFQPVHQERITVNAISVVGLNMTLKVGTETTQLVVTAAPPDLNTENGSLDTTIPNETYSALPVAMSGGPKSPLGFLSQIPGSASGDFGVQDINGGPGNTAFLYQNGLPVTTSEMQGDARNVNGSTSTEVVDQFQIITSGIPAYYGGQGVTNLVLKSGTNQFHGDVYENVRNTAFDAAGFFSTATPVEHQNEYGFSVGGPFLKDKLHFFLNMDRFRYIAGNQPAPYSLPTNAERNGDFSGLSVPIYDPKSTVCDGAGKCTRTPFPNNQIPSTEFSAVALAAQSYLPDTINNNIQNNYYNAFTSGNQQNTYFGKVDWAIAEHHNAYAMFQTGKVSPLGIFNGGPQLALPYASGRGAYQIITIAQVGETWAIRPTLVNVFGAQFNEFKTPFINPTLGGGWPAKIGLNGLPTGPPQDEFPAVGFNGPNSPTVWASNGYSQSFSESAPNFVFQDNLQWTKGKHSVTFGGQFILNEENTTIANTLGGFNFNNTETAGFDANGALVTSTGNAYASYLLGLVDSASATDTTVQETGARYKNWAMYAQDDYKLTHKLTVNIGLRYIIPKPFVEEHDRNSWFNPTLANSAVDGYLGALQFAGDGDNSCHCRTQVQTHYTTFDPRIGFAYSIHPKTVLRGSYTIIHYNGGMLGGNAYSQGVSLLGYSANPSFSSPDSGITPAFNWDDGFPAYQHPPFFDPTLNTGYNTTTGATGGGVSYNRPDTSGRAPYTENWNITLEQALAPSLTWQISYAGSASKHIAVNGGVGIYSDQLPPGDMILGQLLQAPANATTIAEAQAIMPGFALPYSNFVGSIGQALRPFPQYAGVGDSYAQFASESYNSLQTKLQKRMSNGLYFLASYTWSKNINNTGGTINFVYSTPRSAYNLHQERAVDSSNNPHQISLTWVYELPFGKGKRWANGSGALSEVIGGWQISGLHSYVAGTPLGTIGTSVCNVPYTGGCYADYNPGFLGNNARINGSYGSGSNKGNLGAGPSYINKDAFRDPAAFTFGTTPRTMAFGLRNPWYLDEDATVGKNFKLIKSTSLKVQVDAFNIFNRTQFGGINTNIDSTAFGTVGGQANSPRRLQFEAYLKF